MRAWLLFLCSCATLADSGGGETAMPNARAGPFREIRQSELGNSRAAPFALRDDEEFARDVSLVDRDGDATTLEAWAYAAHTLGLPEDDPDAGAPPNAIFRYHAPDGRSLSRTPDLVLEPTEPWETGTVGAPSALRMGGGVWLYYQGGGGVGLAQSSDGLVFVKVAAPVVEDGASPSVLRMPDGHYRMYYARAGAVEEARSPDGLAWQRVGVVIERGASPCAVLGISATGRAIEYLYYTTLDPEPAVALAARYDHEGAFAHAASPVFLGREPWVMRYPSFTLVFATQRAGTAEALDYPAVVVGVAPATSALPAPDM